MLLVACLLTLSVAAGAWLALGHGPRLAPPEGHHRGLDRASCVQRLTEQGYTIDIAHEDSSGIIRWAYIHGVNVGHASVVSVNLYESAMPLTLPKQPEGAAILHEGRHFAVVLVMIDGVADARASREELAALTR